MSEFDELAQRIADGSARRAPSAMLKDTAGRGVVICRTHGRIDDGDTTEWLSLCHEAMAHVNQCGSLVVVESWRGAVYGPVS